MHSTDEKSIINITKLVDIAVCYQKLRELRWPEGINCAWCGSDNIKKNGHDDKHTDCQKYYCKDCGKYFDDLSNTVLSGHHQPLSVWILCLYFMGLNLSNRQIGIELELNESDVQYMTRKLREGITTKKSEIKIDGEVEFDEVYIVAGHKGNANEVKKMDGLEDGIDSEEHAEEGL